VRGGLPGDSVLAEMILSKSSLPSLFTPGVRSQFTTFLSGLNIPIVSGDQPAIVFSNVRHNGQNINVALNGTASYTRGAPYEQRREETGMAGAPGNVTGPWRRSPCCQDFDFAFFTSVEPAATPAPTPEPGTVLLLGTGLLCLARRRIGRSSSSTRCSLRAREGRPLALRLSRSFSRMTRSVIQMTRSLIQRGPFVTL
jgi:hypothetical protein